MCENRPVVVSACDPGRISAIVAIGAEQRRTVLIISNIQPRNEPTDRDRKEVSYGKYAAGPHRKKNGLGQSIVCVCVCVCV